MKMHIETCKFYTVVYILVILWCCTLEANGVFGTYIDSRLLSPSDLVKILSSVQNERSVKPSNSILSMNMNARTINLNVPFTLTNSNTEKIEQKTPEKPIDQVRDDYTLTEGIGYHKLHKTKLNWNDARKACMAENAHLAVINSAEEDKLLRNLIRMNTDIEYQAFIGVHDLFVEGEWTTVTGESLDSTGYNVWATDEPNSYQGMNEDCVTLDKNRGMNDEPCYLKYYYICEIPLEP